MLHVVINDYSTQINGKTATFYAPAQDPTVPGGVASELESISGLDDYPRVQNLTNGIAHNVSPYYPQDFANAYDVNPLWNQGYTGTGQHIAITLAAAPPSDSTLQRFNSVTGASVATVGNGRLKVFAPADLSATGTSVPEAGEDVEASSGLAPSATIDFYEVSVDSNGAATTGGVQNALNEAGTDSSNNWQISNSYGIDCELTSTGQPSPVMGAIETILKTNTATGHDYLFGSGDNGQFCEDRQGVFYPSASWYVTSVGGTTFSAAVNGGYPGEKVWNAGTVVIDGITEPRTSGGGYSGVYGRPSWQASTPNVDPAQNARGFPDVAADADPSTGQFICYGTNATCTGDAIPRGTAPAGDGTSLATPLWAGIMALLNQYVTQHNRPILGFVNPTLYALGDNSQPYTPFHDVTVGDNGIWGAEPGWDPVTGWGSPDAWNIARDLPVSMSYEAEAAANTVTAPAVVASCSICSGGQKVSGISATGKLQFNQVNVGSEGNYQITVSYLYPSSGSQQVNLSINGDPSTTSLSFPASGTPGSLGTGRAIIHLNSGDNTIALTNPGSTGPDIDRIQLLRMSAQYEAESPANSFGASWGGSWAQACSACSGGVQINMPAGASMQFNQVQTDGYGPYDMTVYYNNWTASTITANVSIDGGAGFPVAFPSSGTNIYTVAIQGQALQSGYHTIKFSNPGSGPLSIDDVQVSQGSRSQEAESASISGGASVVACTACSGGLKVTGISGTGQVSFSLLGWGANAFTLQISYTNPDSTYRSATMTVNGQVVSPPIQFWPTGGANVVGTLTLPVTLANGSNSVAFSNSSGLGPDFDKVTLYGAQ